MLLVVLIHLAWRFSDKMIDAAVRFTACSSIAPLGCIVKNNKPLFITEVLKISTNRTVDLLRRELEIQLAELEINGIFYFGKDFHS
jgi:topoisomerase-4 subunit A